MPRFYFHLRDDIVAEDEEGTELADLAAARTYALGSIRDLAAENVRQGHLNLHHRIDVDDEQGERLFTITFREAVAIEG